MSDAGTPFNEFAPPAAPVPGRERARSSAGTLALRVLSASALGLSVTSAVLVVGLHGWKSLGHEGPAWARLLKSAIPLIAIGISYLSLVFALPRTWPQRLLGVAVSTAFILWGVEQYLADARVIAWIDDFVVVLFVFDLGLVVRQNLAAARLERGQPGTAA